MFKNIKLFILLFLLIGCRPEFEIDIKTNNYFILSIAESNNKIDIYLKYENVYCPYSDLEKFKYFVINNYGHNSKYLLDITKDINYNKILLNFYSQSFENKQIGTDCKFIKLTN